MGADYTVEEIPANLVDEANEWRDKDARKGGRVCTGCFLMRGNNSDDLFLILPEEEVLES